LSSRRRRDLFTAQKESHHTYHRDAFFITTKTLFVVPTLSLSSRRRRDLLTAQEEAHHISPKCFFHHHQSILCRPKHSLSSQRFLCRPDAGGTCSSRRRDLRSNYQPLKSSLLSITKTTFFILCKRALFSTSKRSVIEILHWRKKIRQSSTTSY